VFDRRKTIALARANDGTVTGWNPTFGAVMLDLALGVELCWPRSPSRRARSRTSLAGARAVLQAATLHRRRPAAPSLPSSDAVST